MPDIIEVEIQKKLKNGNSPSDVLQDLISSADLSEIDDEDFSSLMCFAAHTNSWKQIADLSLKRLQLNKTIEWAAIAQMLSSTNQLSDDNIISAIIDGATEQNLKSQLYSSKAICNLANEIQTGRDEYINRFEKEYASKEHHIIEKITFFKHESLIDKELEAIKQLDREFPESSELSAIQESFKQRWAQHLISNRHLKIDHEKAETLPELSSDLKKVSNEILYECKKLCKKKPEHAYDFALLFYFMEDYENALEILHDGDSSISIEWLLVELSLLKRHFLQTLDMCRELEQKYNSLPDTQFACAYSNARALWGLNKKAKAISLMQSIVKIKPEYRSSQSLLNKWRGNL